MMSTPASASCVQTAGESGTFQKRRRRPRACAFATQSPSVVRTSAGDKPSSTYEARDLLTSDWDDALFSWYTASELVVVDAVVRLVPGVVGDDQSVAADSFADGWLDYPHYTRPLEFRGWEVRVNHSCALPSGQPIPLLPVVRAPCASRSRLPRPGWP